MSSIKWEKEASAHDWKEDLGVAHGICLAFIQVSKISIPERAEGAAPPEKEAKPSLNHQSLQEINARLSSPHPRMSLIGCLAFGQGIKNPLN